MTFKNIILAATFIGIFINANSQNNDEKVLAKIRVEGFLNSQVMSMLEELTEVYGHR